MTQPIHDFVEPPPANQPATLGGGIQARSTMIYHTVHACVEMVEPKIGMSVNIRWRDRGHQYTIDAAAVFNAADPCRYIRDAVMRLCQAEEVKAPPCVAELAGDIYHINSGWYEFVRHATLGGSGSATLDRIVSAIFAPWSRVATEYYASRIETGHQLEVLTQYLETLSARTLLQMAIIGHSSGRAVFNIPEIHSKFYRDITPHELRVYMRVCLGGKVEPIIKTIDDLRRTPAYSDWDADDRELGERVMTTYNRVSRMR